MCPKRPVRERGVVGRGLALLFLGVARTGSERILGGISPTQQ